MNPAWYGPIGLVSVAVIGGILQVWTKRVGKEADRTDIAKKVSESWDPVFERMHTQMDELDRKCSKCDSELVAVKTALRAVLRAVRAQDPAAVDMAVLAAEALL